MISLVESFLSLTERNSLCVKQKATPEPERATGCELTAES